CDKRDQGVCVSARQPGVALLPEALARPTWARCLLGTLRRAPAHQRRIQPGREQTMFTKILLPVDLSDRHMQALEAATTLAKQSGGVVTLLHVIEIIAGLTLEEEKSFYKRLEKSARQHLTRLAEHLTQQQITWRMEILYGQRGPEVVRYA